MHICQDEIQAALAIFGSASGLRYIWWKIRGKCGKPCNETAGHAHSEPQHFDGPDKNCYQYGCTDDCPVAKLPLPVARICED